MSYKQVPYILPFYCLPPVLTCFLTQSAVAIPLPHHGSPLRLITRARRKNRTCTGEVEAGPKQHHIPLNSKSTALPHPRLTHTILYALTSLPLRITLYLWVPKPSGNMTIDPDLRAHLTPTLMMPPMRIATKIPVQKQSLKSYVLRQLFYLYIPS